VAEDLVRVFTTSSAPEGEIARSLLEEEGIPVLLRGGAEGPYPVGPVELLVAPQFEARARLILEPTQLDADVETDESGLPEDELGED
jgi:hypothetical protein